MKDISSIKQTNPGEVLMISKQIGLIIMTNDIPIIIKRGKLEGKKIADGYILSIQSGLNNKNILQTKLH